MCNQNTLGKIILARVNEGIKKFEESHTSCIVKKLDGINTYRKGRNMGLHLLTRQQKMLAAGLESFPKSYSRIE